MQAIVNGIYIYLFCSTIGDFGHPVGRHGVGDGLGQHRNGKAVATIVRRMTVNLYTGSSALDLLDEILKFLAKPCYVTACFLGVYTHFHDPTVLVASSLTRHHLAPRYMRVRRPLLQRLGVPKRCLDPGRKILTERQKCLSFSSNRGWISATYLHVSAV